MPPLNYAPTPPGNFIQEALVARGWTQADLALIVGRHVPAINEIIHGKRPITPELAVDLAAAFQTTPEVWMEREIAYRLSLVNQSDPETRRRARLMELAPAKEMEKRGWIKSVSTFPALEKEILNFFAMNSLDDEPSIRAVARQTFRAGELTGTQRAWVGRAAQLASIINVRPFSQAGFVSALPEIRKLAESVEKTRHVPRVLAEAGVRLVIVEPLSKSRIDGAAFWLDLETPAPVIVLSARYDRFDSFWHTLAHEMAHIKNGDAQSVDSNLVGETRIETLNEMEDRADREAAEYLLPKERLDSFIVRVRPFYSKVKIVQFAQRMELHPAIVNGQLQYRKEIGWRVNREMLVKIRDILTDSAITDGWGKAPPQLA